jgi:preprotein translocase subunit SecF
MELFKRVTSLDFMGMRKAVGIISILLCFASMLIIYTKGIAFGLEFTGGTQIELRFNQPIELNYLNRHLDKYGFSDLRTRHYGSTKDVLIRLANSNLNAEGKIADKIQLAFQDSAYSVEIRSIEYVGSEVGNQLAKQGVLAIVVAIVAIMLYIAVRFEYRFAVTAALGLVHDTMIVLGILSFFQVDFDLVTLGAVLAMVGYSLNDTIVVFDRVRENFRVVRTGTSYEIINLAINQTLSRTIMTSFLTLLVVVALLLFGGSALHGFSLTLFLGIIIGTYSSIYVSGAFAMYMGLSRSDFLPKARVALDDLP